MAPKRIYQMFFYLATMASIAALCIFAYKIGKDQGIVQGRAEGYHDVVEDGFKKTDIPWRVKIPVDKSPLDSDAGPETHIVVFPSAFASGGYLVQVRGEEQTGEIIDECILCKPSQAKKSPYTETNSQKE